MGEEIDIAEVRPALEYFDIIPNTCKNYIIMPREPSSTPWMSLNQLQRVEWNGTVYEPGDVIYILLSSSRSNAADYAIAELCEIRSLGDGRYVIFIFWFMSVREARRLVSSQDARELSRGWRYVKTTHMQIVMWDCASGKLANQELQGVCPQLVLDMSVSPHRIRRKNASAVRWTNCGWDSNGIKHDTV